MWRVEILTSIHLGLTSLFQSIKNNSFGYLVGYHQPKEQDEVFTIVNMLSGNREILQKDYQEAMMVLPAGNVITILGVHATSDVLDGDSGMIECYKEIEKENNGSKLPFFVFIIDCNIFFLDTNNYQVKKIASLQPGSPKQDVPISLIDQNPFASSEEFAIFRSYLQVPKECSISSALALLENFSLNHEHMFFIHKSSAGSPQTIIDPNSLCSKYLSNYSKLKDGRNSTTTTTTTSTSSSGNHAKKPNSSPQKQTLGDILSAKSNGNLDNLDNNSSLPLTRVTTIDLYVVPEAFRNSKTQSKAPTVSLSNMKNNISTIGSNISIDLDVIIICHRTENMSSVFRHIIDRFIGQLQFAMKLTEQEVRTVKYFHFLPQGYPHIITTAYAFKHQRSQTFSDQVAMQEEEMEARLKQKRVYYHQRFYFSLNQPFLRTNNALVFEIVSDPNADIEITDNDGGIGCPRLVNVHYHCPKPKLMNSSSNSKLYLVKGKYKYYHYMQDHFNDNGWGCAYRSLQTLISYFQMNYSMRSHVAVPNHKQIQQILVDCGDKKADSKFVGSREWIGAFECSVVMDTILGIKCKILSVPRGESINDHNKAFARHFEDQGTPIMIGGGSYAYTMLGICYDEENGKAEYLILDPHYQGKDTDIGTIINSKWCNWRSGKEMFQTDKNFYNFCMPQIPREV